MRFYRLHNLGLYTMAYDIENEAALHGYEIPRDSGTERRHPGRNCNEVFGRMLKDAGLSRKYNCVNPMSVIEINREDSFGNADFIMQLLEDGAIHHSALKKGTAQLYSLQAAEGIIGCMSGNLDYTVDIKICEVKPACCVVSPKRKSVEKGKNKVKNKLGGGFNV